MQLTKTFFPFLFCIILASCAHQHPPENSTQPQQEKVSKKPQEEINKKVSPVVSQTTPKSFKISGVIAVNNSGKGWNANLSWSQQDQNHYTIYLRGPLGGKTVMISKQGTEVTYQEDNTVIKAKSDAELLKKKTNIQLPVNNLYYWVRGLPAPGAVNSSNKDNLGNYTVIKQNGFIVSYNQYSKHKNGVLLPRKIKIVKQNLTIKLVIRSWS